jgi:hypothetical protein
MAIACFALILFRRPFARAVFPVYEGRKALPEPAPRPAEPPPEARHRSALFFLSLLQREGRLVDFVQEEVAPFSDAEVGAAARIVHAGCRKIFRQYLALEPVLEEPEGAKVTVPAGFDAKRVRLTGNVAGQPPYSGILKHPGWRTAAVTLPPVPDALDPAVLAPAEVELP